MQKTRAANFPGEGGVQQVRLELHGPELLNASHPDAQMWEAARLDGAGAAGPPHCALMNLFCTAGHLRAWREAHPMEQGVERTPTEIATLGRAEWGYLVDGSSDTCGCGDVRGDGRTGAVGARGASA